MLEFKYFYQTILLLSFIFNPIKCDRVKRIVGGGPASSPPPPGSVIFVDENYPGDVPSSTTSTTPEPDFEIGNDAIVYTKRGSRRAEVTGTKEDDYYAFKGIRYAEPPIGKRRFQRPIRKHMEGKISATKFGPPCPQPLPNNQGVIGEEDCLSVNVFTPKLPEQREKRSGGLPVLFWIHGGGFRRGSGAQYGARDLVNRGIVVVTVHYRLGSLGFLSQHNNDVPGNVGLWDVNAGLRWVKDYIRFFGGNPKHIVLAGQGTGASIACMVANEKYNEENVRGVFTMSGSSISSFAVDDKEKDTTEKIAQLNQCKNPDSVKFIRCMQKVPYEKIIESDNNFQEDKIVKGSPVKTMGTPQSPTPAVEGPDDGRFLPYFNNLIPIEALKSGQFLKVPLLTGVTKEETSTCTKGNLYGQIGKLFGRAQNIFEGVFKELLTINTGMYSNGRVNPTLDTLFSSQNYLSAMSNSLSSATSQIDKFIEATTDAIFNLPAFITSQLWSKKTQAYLYQFDYQSNKSTGHLFLDGLPLVHHNESQPSSGLGHGDDLIYLFDPCTLNGEPIREGQLTSNKDKQVRDNFVGMVAEFCRTGKPVAKGTSWNAFKDDSSEYLELSNEPKVKTGFRKCQMALWAGLGEILKSAECSALNADELIQSLTGGVSSNLLDPIQVKNIGNSLFKPLPGITNLNNGNNDPTKQIGNLLTNNPIGGGLGLLGGGGNRPNSGNSNQNKRPNSGGFGGILGR